MELRKNPKWKHCRMVMISFLDIFPLRFLMRIFLSSMGETHLIIMLFGELKFFNPLCEIGMKAEVNIPKLVIRDFQEQMLRKHSSVV